SIVSLVNRSDSLSVLRTSDEVLVNANDALHCYDDGCIDFYCRRIQSLVENRPIDYLFCGFGGASYFPNCLRHPEKDDHGVAVAREALPEMKDRLFKLRPGDRIADGQLTRGGASVPADPVADYRSVYANEI